MTEEEKLHKLIHVNLSLLQENGHRFESKEGMFEKHNITGFETVGYALLMIINPVECKRLIPWPLMDSKSLRSEFRTKFSEFIKTTKSKHPDGVLSEIRASELQFPGGIKFLRFMYKLSTFTVELELKRLMRQEEQENLLPRPIFTSKLKDNETKLKIVQEGRSVLQAELWNYKHHQETALPLLRALEENNNRIQREVNRFKEKLTSEVSSLEFKDEVKLSLMDVENLNCVEEWNSNVKEKSEDLEGKSKQLRNYRDLCGQTCQLIRSIQAQKQVLTTDAPCLDGTKLHLSHTAHSVARVHLYNSRGQIKLDSLLKCAQSSAEELVSKSPLGSPLLPQAKEVRDTLEAQRNRADELSLSLDNMIESNIETIKQLRPIVYDRFRDKPVPDYFQHFKPIPPVHFRTPTSICKSFDSPFKRGGRSRLPLLARSGFVRKTLNTVVVSVKQRRRSGGHSIFTTRAPRHQHLTTDRKVPNSTRIPRSGSSFKKYQYNLGTSHGQIGARKSLFGKLPVGTKDMVSMGTTSTPANLHSSTKATVPSFCVSSSDNSYASEPSQPSFGAVHSSLPTPRNKRKSLQLVVEKYAKLKEKMEKSKDFSVKPNS